MSRTFSFRFKNFTEIINNEIKRTPIKLKLCVFGALIGGNFCYAISTKKEADIIVYKKYQFDRNGFTEFMIIDDRGNHYNINNSFWYWKWNSIEDWHKLKTYNTIHIRYYGIRLPLLGLFPNIVAIYK